MVGGAWRRPRMKVYDYNQEFGGNYYQPMIQYINKKDIYGPFMKRQDVYLPHSAEVTSDKYTNMRYQDKSSAKHNLDDFLKSAYAKQMKELNGTTASVHYNQLHSDTNLSTPYSDRELLGSSEASKRLRRHYLSELEIIKRRDDSRMKEELEMMPTTFLEEVRQRNRIDRLRRACRDEINSSIGAPSIDPEVSRLLESGPILEQVNPEYSSYILPDSHQL